MKSNFFLLCSLAPCQQVRLNGHSAQGWRGKVLLCSTIQKKRLKLASFCDPADSWPGFSAGNREPQGISEKSLTAARLLRSGLSLLQGGCSWREQRSLESVQCPERKADFLILLNVPSSWRPPYQCRAHCVGRVVAIWYDNWETCQCLASGTGIALEEESWRRCWVFYRDFSLSSTGKSKLP